VIRTSRIDKEGEGDGPQKRTRAVDSRGHVIQRPGATVVHDADPLDRVERVGQRARERRVETSLKERKKRKKERKKYLASIWEKRQIIGSSFRSPTPRNISFAVSFYFPIPLIFSTPPLVFPPCGLCCVFFLCVFFFFLFLCFVLFFFCVCCCCCCLVPRGRSRRPERTTATQRPASTQSWSGSVP
jgi:hypothetical protein